MSVRIRLDTFFLLPLLLSDTQSIFAPNFTLVSTTQCTKLTACPRGCATGRDSRQVDIADRPPEGILRLSREAPVWSWSKYVNIVSSRLSSLRSCRLPRVFRITLSRRRRTASGLGCAACRKISTRDPDRHAQGQTLSSDGSAHGRRYVGIFAGSSQALGVHCSHDTALSLVEALKVGGVSSNFARITI